MSAPQRRLAGCAVAFVLAATSCGTEPHEPTALSVVSGNGQTGAVGQTLPSPLVVKVVDASGAGVRAVVVEWSVVSGRGSLSSRATTTDAWGRASVTWTLSLVAGSDTVSASITGHPRLAFSATALAGPAAKLVFSTQPSGWWSTLMMPSVAVAIADTLGNTVTSATDTVTIALGTNAAGGMLAGTTTMSAVNGVAHFAVSIAQPGRGYTITATARGLSAATTPPFEIVATLLSISAGASHACGVTTSGAAYCWGNNTFGELGSGSTAGPEQCIAGVGLYVSSYDCSTTPVPVSGGLTFVSVSAGSAGAFLDQADGGVGSAHTCGVTTSGAAYCWGGNSFGELGTGSFTGPQQCVSGFRTLRFPYGCSTTPLPVSGGLAFVAISAGSSHTCGVTTSGAAYCWGTNGSGELGNGSDTGPQWCLTDGGYGRGMGAVCSTTPVPVSGGLAFVAISAGSSHTCGVTTSGLAYCWGSNGHGELGNGSTNESSTPTAVSGGLAFVAISAGSAHTCGVTTSGVAYCWGGNGHGELGDGSVAGPEGCSGPGFSSRCSTTPLEVSGGFAFVGVSAGYSHSCGVAKGGTAYCWGTNYFGELGVGSTDSGSTPAAVSGGLGFATVSAGNEHTCGFTTAGAAYCWGSNTFGELGNGSTAGPQTCFGQSCGTAPVLVIP